MIIHTINFTVHSNANNLDDPNPPDISLIPILIATTIVILIISSFLTYKAMCKDRKVEDNDMLDVIDKEMAGNNLNELEGEEIELEDSRDDVSDYLMSLYYMAYEEIHEGKSAIWRGKVTKQFLTWYEQTCQNEIL